MWVDWRVEEMGATGIMLYTEPLSTRPNDTIAIVFDSESDFEAAAREIILGAAIAELQAKPFKEIWPALKKKLLEGE